ncbi:MAG TPA: peptide chain release factor N(5)-glutamine methyltransferase [Bacteroidetes bacterium]|jgi:release factor glutamine methyltransferase|nr:peptide chain release factor N(5)-glutamine methyltransferase [Bacteroidota bacterium]
MKLGLLKALYIDTLVPFYARSEAENIFYIVLEHLDKKSKIDVLLGAETFIFESYESILEELQQGIPVQYLTQIAPFYNLELFVSPGVLIPRPETEQLVHLVLEENRGTHKKVLDIGTGSGCIALALKNAWNESTITACDISEEALEVARKNAKDLSINVDFYQTDILTNEIAAYDILVSNPPYISLSEKDTMHKNVIENEPHLALFVADKDPLIFYKRIIQLAEKQRAICYFETSEFYRTSLDSWLIESGYSFEWKDDFQGKDRILKVIW